MEKIAIRNQHNEIIGYVVDYDNYQEVRNAHGELVGRVLNGHTYDVNGNMVSWQENPGLLFGSF